MNQLAIVDRAPPEGGLGHIRLPAELRNLGQDLVVLHLMAIGTAVGSDGYARSTTTFCPTAERRPATWSQAYLSAHLSVYKAKNRYLGANMFRPCCIAVLLASWFGIAHAGYLDENPDEVFESVYERIGTLPVQATRDPDVWLRLQELKREPCDQKSIEGLAQILDRLGYRRQAADGLYKFVLSCGAPMTALNRSVNIYLKITDYPKAVEVADEYVRRAPSDREAHYLRGVALDGAGDHKRALADYSDAIELFGADKKKISSRVFLKMASAYAALKEFCEATAPINQWVALDPATRDTSQTQKIIADYEQQGNCVSSTEPRSE